MSENQQPPDGRAGDPTQLGDLLRRRRKEGGWSVREIAADLRLTTTALRDLESGRWGRLGAPVYVKGYLRSYGRRVGIDVSDWDVAPPPAAPADETGNRGASTVRRRRRIRTYGRLASYLIATALLAIPAVVGVIRAFQQPEIAATESPTRQLATMAPITLREEVEAATAADDPPAAEPDADPAGEEAAEARAADQELVLQLTEEVWMDVSDLDGNRLAFGLKEAGETLVFSLRDGIHARLGNADAVAATVAGEPFDLAPYMTRDVAEFDLESAAGGEPTAR